MSSNTNLATFIAQACHYAQDHIDDAEAWPSNIMFRENLLQCTSYQAACFLAQNTLRGREGVEWGVIIDKLSAHPAKSVDEWLKIINTHAEDLGGWIDRPAELRHIVEDGRLTELDVDVIYNEGDLKGQPTGRTLKVPARNYYEALVMIRDLVPGESEDPDRDLARMYDIANCALSGESLPKYEDE